jgi:hypothetical protein
VDSHGMPMPYSDGLNYVMKWQGLKVKAGRKGKGKVEGAGVGAGAGVGGKVDGKIEEGSVVGEGKAQEEPVVDVKEEQPVHVQA